MTQRTGFLQRLAQSIRHRAVPFAVVVVLVPLVAVVVALSQDDEYEATATMLIGGLRGEAPDDRQSATSRELLELPAIAEQASRTLGGVSPADVEDAVEVEVPDDASVLKVTATSDSADQAADIANAYARAYAIFRDGIRPIGARPPDVTLVQPAVAPGDASSPSVLGIALLGLAGGLVLGALLAALLDHLTRRVRSIDELEEIYELPVLARVPRSRNLAKRALMGETVKQAVGFSEEAEAFRALRTNLRYFNVDSQIRSILVASPLPGDGKSTVARHLAITMASMGDSVCLVDADLRKRDAAALPGTEGLSLVLAGFDLEGALTEIPIAFDAITDESRMLVELDNGPLPPNPSELLESARMRWVLGELERRFDVVIIDSPALVTVSDALTLVPVVSGVLIVSGVERTFRQAALDLRKQVDLLGGRPLGVVANFSSPSRGYDYYDDHSEGTRTRRSRSRERTPA